MPAVGPLVTGPWQERSPSRVGDGLAPQVSSHARSGGTHLGIHRVIWVFIEFRGNSGRSQDFRVRAAGAEDIGHTAPGRTSGRFRNSAVPAQRRLSAGNTRNRIEGLRNGL